MSRNQLTNILALIVAGVWVVAILAGIVTKDYTALGAITPVMLIVAGFLFGYRGGNGNGSTRKKGET